MSQNQTAGIQTTAGNNLGDYLSYERPRVPVATDVELRRWAVQQATIVAPSRNIRDFIRTADAIRAFALTGAVPE